jgi:hypothetical protein
MAGFGCSPREAGMKGGNFELDEELRRAQLSMGSRELTSESSSA